jgi:hypothetical protein
MEHDENIQKKWWKNHGKWGLISWCWIILTRKKLGFTTENGDQTAKMGMSSFLKQCNICINIAGWVAPGNLSKILLETAMFSFHLKCFGQFKKTKTPNSSNTKLQWLVDGIHTPLKNMSSSVGIMTFQTECKVIIQMFQSPPTSNPIINHH